MANTAQDSSVATAERQLADSINIQNERKRKDQEGADLCFACFNGEIDEVARLLEARADPNLPCPHYERHINRDRYGNLGRDFGKLTPLKLACAGGGHLPHAPCTVGDNDRAPAVKCLIEARAAVNIEYVSDVTESSPLTIAIMRKEGADSMAILKHLLEAKADLNIGGKDHDLTITTVCMASMCACKGKGKAAFRTLLQAKADVNLFSSFKGKGKGPLHITAQTDQIHLRDTNFDLVEEVLLELIAANADIDLQNSEGKTALQLARDTRITRVLENAEHPFILTLNAVPDDAGSVSIVFSSAAGEHLATFDVNDPRVVDLGTTRVTLAEQLQVDALSLRVVLPDGRCLAESDENLADAIANAPITNH